MSDEFREIEALSSKFEAVQIAMNKDKTGYILKLSLHPNDVPEEMLRDPVGTRYLIVAVRLDGEDKPLITPDQRNGLLAIKSAAAAAKDPRFQSWLCQQNLADEMSEDAAAQAIRDVCEIKSRSELKTNKAAQGRWLALRDEFADNLRRGIVT